MNKIFSYFLAGVGALGLLAAPVVYTQMPSPPVKVFSNPGGSIFEFMDFYGQVRDSGAKLEVRGVCASACTFFLGMLPKEQVCYDDFAYLGFHGVYSGGFLSPPTFNQPMTKWTYEYTYTPEVIQELETLGWSMEHDVNLDEHPTGMIWQGPSFLSKLGYEVCD